MSEQWNPKKPIGTFQRKFPPLVGTVSLLCMDCAHARGSDHFPGVGRLTHCAKSIHQCPVDGHEEMSLCYDVRAASGLCGPEARLFEAKVPNDAA